MKSWFFVLSVALIPSTQGFSFLLDEVMNHKTQQETGVSKLSQKQKKALEAWMNDHFVLKAEPTPAGKDLFLSLNLHAGHQIQLSDGSLWDVAPDDVEKASIWISPFKVEILPSQDPDYPQLLVNTLSGVSIRVKAAQQPSNPTNNGNAQ